MLSVHRYRQYRVNVVLCLLLLLLSVAPAAASQTVVLIVGDSLSAAYNMRVEQGWVALLEQRLAVAYPNTKVVNASVSGETTGNGLRRLPDLLQQHSPDVLVLELGGNDGLRGFRVAGIESNLSKMLAMAQQQEIQIVFTGVQIPPNYGPKYTQQFAAIYPRLAKQYNAHWVPFILAGVADDSDKMQADGIHPTATAQPLILANMWAAIEAAIRAGK